MAESAERTLRTAIAEAEKAEPVAWRYRPGMSWPWALTDDGYLASCKRPSYQVEPLFTHPPQPPGEVVVTKNDAGQIVAVTRQDEDGRVLSVIAESAPPQRKPLTNEQIDDAHKTEKLALLSLMYNNDTSAENFTRALRILARAVERAHGIGDQDE